MGQDLGEGDRDSVEVMMAQGEQSDEVVTDSKDVPEFTKMGNGENDNKMENVNNSTKNGD